MTRWLAGRYDRKAVYQLSIAIFALGVVVAARAATPMQFVTARVVQMQAQTAFVASHHPDGRLKSQTSDWKPMRPVREAGRPNVTISTHDWALRVVSSAARARASSGDGLEPAEPYRDQLMNTNISSHALVDDREKLRLSRTHRQNQAPTWLELFEQRRRW
ncbi:hypothetical protein OL599_23620, partial [Rhodovastum sp. RN2-1]